MLIKILGIILLFVGESLAIYIEVLAAHEYQNKLFWPLFLKMLLTMTLAGGFLVAGYMFGMRGFRDIWIVSAISIVSIIFMEPIINYAVFQQLPTKGTAIALVLGILGLVSMIVI